MDVEETKLKKKNRYGKDCLGEKNLLPFWGGMTGWDQLRSTSKFT